MSVIGELQQSLDEIPDQVIALLRQESEEPKDTLPEAYRDTEPASNIALSDMATVLKNSIEILDSQGSSLPSGSGHNVAPLIPDFSSSQPGLESFPGGPFPISRGEDLAPLAGSLHSAELDILESPGGGVIEILTRIADGIEELVEQGKTDDRHDEYTGPTPGKSDYAWNLLDSSYDTRNSSSPSIEPGKSYMNGETHVHVERDEE